MSTTLCLHLVFLTHRHQCQGHFTRKGEAFCGVATSRLWLSERAKELGSFGMLGGFCDLFTSYLSSRAFLRSCKDSVETGEQYPGTRWGGSAPVSHLVLVPQALACRLLGRGPKHQVPERAEAESVQHQVRS